MAYSILPTWPLILFGVVEPAMLVWAYVFAMTDPNDYYAKQIPRTPLLEPRPTQEALSLTYQIGNVMLLLAFMALICCWTSHPDTARKYLIAVAIADLGHIYAAYQGLGESLFWDVSKWNDMAWGNIGVSAFLHVNRLATVLGLFGKMGGSNAVKTARMK